MASPFRSVFIISAVIGGLVITAVSVALLAAPSGVAEFPADSPEGVVQRYIQALQDRDTNRAYEMLSSRAREDNSRDDFRMYTRHNIVRDRNWRIRISDVGIDGDRATVVLTYEYTGGGALDFNRYSHQETVPLVREDGEWKIDDPFAAIGSVGGFSEAG